MATAVKNTPGATRVEAERTGAEAELVAESAQRAAAQAQLTLHSALRDTGYAVVGAGDFAVATVRNLRKASAELPHQALELVEQTPELIRAGFEDLSTRGRLLTARIRNRDEVQNAVAQTRAAKNQVQVAKASVDDAASAQAEAVADSAQALGDPAPAAGASRVGPGPRTRNTRYEERSLEELQALAAQRNVPGRALMDKEQLIAALRRA